VTERKLGFGATVKSLPRAVWIANTMEIFERMSWYGMFTVLALYVTAPAETGGLGFTTEARGNIQAVITFLLYLMGIVTGALADRYGYKKMFIIAYLIMIVAYSALYYCRTMPSFLIGFFIVAVGAAIFKPVIVGTIARVTDGSNSAMAFGIFYMMVNIGGFVGPIVAGYVRGWGWEFVFYASSIWAAVNLLLVSLFYREPTTEAASGKGRTLKKVMTDLVEVLGNVRFFITVFVVLIALQLASFGFSWFTWRQCRYFIPIWLVLNFIYDVALPAGSGDPRSAASKGRMFLAKRMHCSNWRFALFLFIMSGFWTSFNQIFYTMPEYIRDFVDTRPLIRLVEGVVGSSDAQDPAVGVGAAMSRISPEERVLIEKEVKELIDARQSGTLSEEATISACKSLIAGKVRLTPDELREFVSDDRGGTEAVTNRIIIAGRQVNAEFIVNFDAGAIVILQVLISFLMAKFHRFTTMIVGMLIAAVGIGLSFVAGGEGMIGAGGSVVIVILGIVTFAIGEMMASPTSQEYVGRIAPEDKKALYMGYYFLAIALGNLFGGLLSGQMYGRLALRENRPDLMWLAFGGIMFATALAFMLYNRLALPKHASDSLTPDAAAGA